MSKMKACATCQATAEQSVKTCWRCGEGSWTGAAVIVKKVPRPAKSEETIKEMVPPSSSGPELAPDTDPSPTSELG